jgi:antitoxin HicB
VSARTYTIFLDPDFEEGGYTVTVPALPGCVTQGESIEECIERAREAIGGHIAALIETGQPVPAEAIRPQAIAIDVAVSEELPAGAGRT